MHCSGRAWRAHKDPIKSRRFGICRKKIWVSVVRTQTFPDFWMTVAPADKKLNLHVKKGLTAFNLI
jgi:hypothetical protein